MRRILVVDDEPGLLEFLRMELELDGNQVDVVETGYEALSLFQAHGYDVVLLDIMLPDLDGIEVCRRIRLMSDVPILMLTARGAVADKVQGFSAGADDYLVKPFAIEELLVRLEAVERRMGREGAASAHLDGSSIVMRAGDISVQLDKHRVTLSGRPIDLTVREFELLVHLIRNANRVLSRDDLLREVWGYGAHVDTNVVDVYIGYLRQKLDPEKRHLRTVRGVGFMFHEADE